MPAAEWSGKTPVKYQENILFSLKIRKVYDLVMGIDQCEIASLFALLDPFYFHFFTPIPS
jgi:hypothetical protein